MSAKNKKLIRQYEHRKAYKIISAIIISRCQNYSIKPLLKSDG